MANLVINEFLCCLSAQFDKIARDNLISMLHDFYGYRASLEAKNILISECEKISVKDSISEFTIKRVEGKSGALRRVITDAVDIWTVVDREKKGEWEVQFVAADPNQLPGVNIEKISLQFLIASINKLQEKVDAQDTVLGSIKDKLDAPPAAIAPQNKNKGKRKLSGSADVFTPKRHLASASSANTTSSASVAASSSYSHGLHSSSVALSAPSYFPAALASELSATVALSDSAAPSETATPSDSSATSESAAPSGSAALSESVAVPESTALTDSPALSQSAALSALSSLPAVPASSVPSPSLELPSLQASIPPAPPESEIGSQLDLFETQRPLPSHLPPPLSPSTTKEQKGGKFADTVKKLASNKNDWILVERKRRNIVPAVGTGAATGLEGVPSVKRDHWDIALQRLNASTTTELNVKSHLEERNIEVKEVHLFPSKRKGSVTARVRVALKDKQSALNPSNFGPFIQVSSWTIKSKSARKNDAISGKDAKKTNGES